MCIVSSIKENMSVTVQLGKKYTWKNVAYLLLQKLLHIYINLCSNLSHLIKADIYTNRHGHLAGNHF